MTPPDDPRTTRVPQGGSADSATPPLQDLSALHETLVPAPAGTTSPPAASRDRLSLPGYDLLGELGRGGMGVVYKARQVKLDRVVALKMILTGAFASDRERKRFQAEAEAIARLQHPNIVQIYEIGEHDGLPFFSLEFCAGGSLARQLESRTLTPAEAATLVETLAGAVAAAHRAGVVHRDLKPANVLLTADGLPKITDFGLAKRVGEAGLTASGAVVGTPSYMAPEQARGKAADVGPAADVYALGAILYELLAGRPPFQAGSAYDTICQVLSQEPAAPSSAGRRLPRDLETICLKCLEKDPARRYASADDLADDLRRFRAGEPTAARPAGRLGRLWRRARRSPVLAGLAVAVVALTAGVIVLATRGSQPDAPVEKSADKPAEDEVLQVVAGLDRTDPGWRLEQLEARRKAMPPERNSALRIEAARRLLPADWGKWRDQYEKAFGSRAVDDPPTREQRAALEDLRRRAAAALTEARALADLPEGRHAGSYARDWLTTLLPHVQDTRTVIDLLKLESLGQALDSHPAEALAACRAMVNASRSLNDEPQTMVQLARIAGVTMAVRATEHVLRLGAPPAAEMERLQRLLEREGQEPVLRLMARAERGGLHWLMSSITSGDFDIAAATDPLKGDPGLAAALKPMELAARHGHAWLLRHLTRLDEIARLPDHEQREAMREWDRVARTAPRGAHEVLPAGVKLVEAGLRHRAVVRTAAAALAVERYRLRHGRWPEKLADLGPGLLPSGVPSDPYDGRPLRYVRTADGVTVYSVGTDGKDNGGTLDPANPFREGTDIGFRLWDASRRE